MHKNMALFEPTITAIVTPPILCAVVTVITEKGMRFEILGVVFAALIVSFLHAVLLGLPAVLLLRKLDKIRWWSLAFVGFVVGGTPVAFLLWPLGAEGGFSYWDGAREVVTRKNGMPTLAGWTEYIKTVAYMATIGATSGFAFWFSQRRISKLKLNTDAKSAG